MSRTMSRPFAEEWGSDEDEEDDDADPFSLFSVIISNYL